MTLPLPGWGTCLPSPGREGLVFCYEPQTNKRCQPLPVFLPNPSGGQRFVITSPQLIPKQEEIKLQISQGAILPASTWHRHYWFPHTSLLRTAPRACIPGCMQLGPLNPTAIVRHVETDGWLVDYRITENPRWSKTVKKTVKTNRVKLCTI